MTVVLHCNPPKVLTDKVKRCRKEPCVCSVSKTRKDVHHLCIPAPGVHEQLIHNAVKTNYILTNYFSDAIIYSIILHSVGIVTFLIIQTMRTKQFRGTKKTKPATKWIAKLWVSHSTKEVLTSRLPLFYSKHCCRKEILNTHHFLLPNVNITEMYQTHKLE